MLHDMSSSSPLLLLLLPSLQACTFHNRNGASSCEMCGTRNANAGSGGGAGAGGGAGDDDSSAAYWSCQVTSTSDLFLFGGGGYFFAPLSAGY